MSRKLDWYNTFYLSQWSFIEPLLLLLFFKNSGRIIYCEMFPITDHQFIKLRMLILWCLLADFAFEAIRVVDTSSCSNRLAFNLCSTLATLLHVGLVVGMGQMMMIMMMLRMMVMMMLMMMTSGHWPPCSTLLHVGLVGRGQMAIVTNNGDGDGHGLVGIC